MESSGIFGPDSVFCIQFGDLLGLNDESSQVGDDIVHGSASDEGPFQNSFVEVFISRLGVAEEEAGIFGAWWQTEN